MERAVASTINIHAWQYPEVRLRVTEKNNVVDISIGSDIAIIMRREQAEELQARLVEVLYGK